MDDEQYIEAWTREFYNRCAHHEIMEQAYFESVALGFFIAKGATPEKAYDLAQECQKRDLF